MALFICNRAPVQAHQGALACWLLGMSGCQQQCAVHAQYDCCQDSAKTMTPAVELLMWQQLCKSRWRHRDPLAHLTSASSATPYLPPRTAPGFYPHMRLLDGAAPAISSVFPLLARTVHLLGRQRPVVCLSPNSDTRCTHLAGSMVACCWSGHPWWHAVGQGNLRPTCGSGVV